MSYLYIPGRKVQHLIGEQLKKTLGEPFKWINVTLCGQFYEPYKDWGYWTNGHVSVDAMLLDEPRGEYRICRQCTIAKLKLEAGEKVRDTPSRRLKA